jgi:hypothetical protein
LTQFERGKPIIIDVEITNTGRTPATHVLKSAIEDSTLVPRDKPMPDRIESLQKSLPNSPGASLPPNGGYTMSFGRSISGTDQSEISASYDAIKSRQLVLYILGTVHYEDVFGISHNTNWCVWISNPDTKTEPVPEIRTVR